MKSVVFLFLLLLAVLTGCEDNSSVAPLSEVKEPDTCSCGVLKLDETYNHMYYSERSKPYTGVCFSSFPNGNPKQEKSYTDGKVNGVVREWHINGTLKEEKHFKMNLQHGSFVLWDESGRVVYHADYEKGQMDTVYVYIPGAF